MWGLSAFNLLTRSNAEFCRPAHYSCNLSFGILPDNLLGPGRDLRQTGIPLQRFLRKLYLLRDQATDKKRMQWGLDQGRSENLCVAQTRAGCTNRVHRMDAGWSPETFEVCRVEGG
jgi:hypothetical protein